MVDSMWGGIDIVLYLVISNDNKIKNERAGIQIKLKLSCGVMIR